MTKKVQEKTAAESKSIGFDYQYYYFLYELLQIKKGETIGYEVRDDVHIEKTNGRQILIQLKHSVEQKADGNIINLTEKDEDLWKTISNWIDMVNDKEDGRSSLENQLSFLLKTEFLLVTNKSKSQYNNFIDKIKEFKEGNQNLKNIRDYLTKQSTPKEGKKSSVVDGYIEKLNSQKDEWLNLFFNNLDFLLSQDKLIELIKTKIIEKNLSTNRVEDVYRSIDSRLRELIYDDVKAGKKVIISFEDYYQTFTRYFEIKRSRKLPIMFNNPDNPTPQNAKNRLAIRQLIDAGIIGSEDKDFEDKLIEVFTCIYLMSNNVEKWLQDSELTNEELQIFNRSSIKKWKNKFDKAYRKIKRQLREKDTDKIDPEEMIEAAEDCYYEVLDTILSLDETELDVELSNGQFYILSELLEIGWHYNWKERYISND
ncbi:hypothetical protein [Priestia megaterium]